jgi:eukaryotic-like serine/threonine-protein kinase
MTRERREAESAGTLTPAEAETLTAESVGIDRPGAPPPRVLADRYELLGLLGSGGMGTVYRARDLELDELVALKMLKERMWSSAGALERFRSEVKLARRVTHRNVARTFDIGEHGGGKFLTMEFVDGQMLRTVLSGSRYLPLADVVRIGTDICAGLSAAHAAGVLHRDLKPENVIVARDRGAVITDFGIARALAHSESSRTAGEVAGTPDYMAPEQLENGPLDERTDVYALGVVLFELLTGVLPWEEESPVKAAMARLRERPPDVRTRRSSLSEAVSSLVARCLSTRREDRFASAAHVAEALMQIGVTPMSTPSLAPAPRPPRSPPRATLAALPLAHTGGQKAYLAESVTDDLVELLGAMPDILVVHAPPTTLEPRAAGRALGVQAVLAGTFACRDDRIEVSLSMTTVEDGFEIWARSFERPVGELLAIADDAAGSIARALSSHVTTSPRSLPTDPHAYDLYLRGRSVFLRGWYDASGESIRLLGEAHARSPDNPTLAAAYARALARAYGVDLAGDGRAATEAAERAVALDPSRAEGRLALALMHLYRGDGLGAASELARANAAAPSDTDVLELLGRLQSEVGPLDEALAHLEVVLAREPTFAEARYTATRAHALLGDWARAEALLGPEPIDPAGRVPHLLTRARLLLWRADRRGAAELGRRFAEIHAGPRERATAALFLEVAARGTVTEGDVARLSVLFPTGASTPQRRAAFNAQIRTEMLLAGGARDAALVALSDCDANGLLDLMWLERCPLLVSLRDAPELQGVLRNTRLRAARVRALLAG